MSRILASADIAHYEPWPVELSTLPTSHACISGIAYRRPITQCG
jgi:hypothetical protein